MRRGGQEREHTLEEIPVVKDVRERHENIRTETVLTICLIRPISQELSACKFVDG